MIDRTKNVCYVIQIPYVQNHKEYKQKFLSLHGLGTEKFNSFKNRYFRDALRVSAKKIGGLDGSVGSQTTVSKEVWCRMKIGVLEGITESEKCY